MGTIRKGALGGFSGKAGSIIGSSWRDISYIKGLPKLSNKPKSEKQLEQQARFSMALRFLLPVKDFLNIGFNDLKQGRSTGFNVAIKTLLAKAIIGIYPALEIDYPFAEFARGPLSSPDSVTVTPQAAKLVLNWATDVVFTSGNTDDELIVLVHEPSSNNYVAGPPNAVRSGGMVEVVMPSDWIGMTVHIYVYFISKKGDRVSNSKYAGTAIIV